MFQPQIFRKESLEKMTSLDRLDELLPVTSARTWLIQLSLVLLLLLVITWAIFGTLVIRIEGKGIINEPILQVHAHSAGMIDTVAVRPGDEVIKGQFLGRIIPEEALRKINLLESQIYLLKQKGYGPSDAKMRSLSDSLVQYRSRTEPYTYIICPVTGKITELNIMEGSEVTPETILFNIQNLQTGNAPIVYFYLSPDEAAGIHPGMPVIVTVGGTSKLPRLYGEVTDLGQYPASADRIGHMLDNEYYKEIPAEKGLYETRASIRLTGDIDLHQLNAESGQPCRVEVIVTQCSPISLLLK